MTIAPETFTEIETARLVVRALAPGDEQRLQALLEAGRDYFQALHGIPGPPPDAAARELAATAAPGRTVAVLTLAGTGEDVGVLGWWRGNPEPDVALLGMVIVAPPHRGRGLAREALEGLEVWLAGGGTRALRTAFPYRRFAVTPIVRALGFREMPIAEHTRLGLAGAGTSLWEKPIGAG